MNEVKNVLRLTFAAIFAVGAANALYRSVMGDAHDLDEVWVKEWAV